MQEWALHFGGKVFLFSTCLCTTLKLVTYTYLRCPLQPFRIQSINHGESDTLYLTLASKGDPSASGGVHVIAGNFFMYGQVKRHIFKMSSSLAGNRFLHFRFTIIELHEMDRHDFCLYEKYEESSTGAILKDGTNRFCFSISGGRLILPSGYIVKDDEFDRNPLNLAIGRKTVQSSTFGPGTSDGAVNGRIGQLFNYNDWESNSVTHTKSEMNPWWEVDLGDEFVLREIVIYARKDAYHDDLSNHSIQIRSADGTLVKEFHSSEDGDDTSTIHVHLKNATGKFVRITLNGDSHRVLCLAEVQIFGNIQELDVAIGKIYNLPESTFDRIEFTQKEKNTVGPNRDIDDTTLTSTMIRDVSFYMGTSEEMLVSI